jgi:hypothetical protein
MDFDRNRYFMFGVIIFLLGMQFRMIDSFVLNESSTRTLHRIAKRSQIASTDMRTNVYMTMAPSPKKSVTPPPWFGWAMLTIGGVMCLHAMVLPRRK